MPLSKFCYCDSHENSSEHSAQILVVYGDRSLNKTAHVVPSKKYWYMHFGQMQNVNLVKACFKSCLNFTVAE
jgi:hypothetical protein